MEQYLEAMRQDPAQKEAELERLQREAPSDGQARNLAFERARKALRAGDLEEARGRFQSLWNENPDDAVASRAVYELGRIADEYDSDWEEARRLLRRAIVDTAPWAGADFALDYLLRQESRDERYESLTQLLAEMAADVEDGRMAARLHLERGRVLADALRRPNDALRAYRSAFERCADCAATDDAVFEMGQLYERFRMWDAAVEAYAVVAVRVEPAAFVGTYTSHRASDARYQMGIVELLHRHNFDDAAEHFETYLDDFPNHRRSDDAAWHLVTVEYRAGDEESVRRALERFVEEFPHSRHAERAQRKLAEVT